MKSNGKKFLIGGFPATGTIHPSEGQKHNTVSLSTDASRYGWGCAIHQAWGVRVSMGKLFVEVSERNILLSLRFFVESCANKRRFSGSDTRLSQGSFASVETAFRGQLGHSFDLMVLDSNAMRGKEVYRWPIFHLSHVLSRGVNVLTPDLHIAPVMTNPYAGL